MIIFVFLIISLTIIACAIAVLSEAANPSQITFGCTRIGSTLRCDPMGDRFNSLATTGQIQRIATINLTKFESSEGVFGDSASVSGFKQQYFTISNHARLNPRTFYVSLWVNQDAGFAGNTSIMSHVNSAKTAGWFLDSAVRKHENIVQFSVTNSGGKIFKVSAPLTLGIFENIIASFDGKSLKLYHNGFLVNSTTYTGKYLPDPETPVSLGVNSNDFGRAWSGKIDEVRLYDHPASVADVQKLVDYSTYSRSKKTSIVEDGLLGYWPFDSGSPRDGSGEGNNAKVVSAVASMSFAPDGSLFFSVRNSGEIQIMNSRYQILGEPFVDLQKLNPNNRANIYGITLDPQFESNHFLYAYVTQRVNGHYNSDTIGRVIRFTEMDNKAANEKILIDNIPADTARVFGGALAFGRDDSLYVATPYVAKIAEGQNANLSGSVLRIDRNGAARPDNPFPNSPVYTSGHRSIFGIAFSNTKENAAAVTGLVAENGGRYNDEINVLKKGGNYGFPYKSKIISPSQPSQSNYIPPTDNITAEAPARTYFKLITPTQMIFYDGNKFPALRDKFVVCAYGENSIYALAINDTGGLGDELDIRLPDLRGHLIAIAKSPTGDIFLGGESIYKLISIGSNREVLTYFVNAISNNSTEVSHMLINLSSKVLSFEVMEKGKDVTGSVATPALSLQLKVPKSLLGGIYDATSEKYNMTHNANDKLIGKFKIKENRKVANIGDTILDIKLTSNIVAPDKIIVKGQTSSLIPTPARQIAIYR